MNTIAETVHIIPLGYEFDRAVIPFQKFLANRVHILTIKDLAKHTPLEHEKNKYQRHFDQKVKEHLESLGIKVIIHEIDLFDILAVMQEVSAIIIQEKQEGNLIYLNMSACGHLTSVAATLAAMAHDVTIYYVKADEYTRSKEEISQHGLSICHQLNNIIIQNFKISLPDPANLKLLGKLANEDRELSTDEILTYLLDEGVQGFTEQYKDQLGEERRKVQSRILMKLNATMKKLEDANYIFRRKQGRNSYFAITDSGRYIAAISGKFENNT